jgi:hypothetical protein
VLTQSQVIKYVLIGTFVACYGGVFGTLIMTMINVLRASPFSPPPRAWY